MRAVLDTNVLVSGVTGFAIDGSIPGSILRAWRDGAFELVTSPHILAEFARALTKPYFRRRLSPMQIEAAVELFATESIVVSPREPRPDVAPDPADDLVLATALASAADYLVTGDRELQELREHDGIAIITPAAFLELLRGQGEE